MTSPTFTRTITHPTGQYPVHIGPGLLHNLLELAAINGPVAVITDNNVHPHYAHLIPDPICVLKIPAGEKHKNLRTIHKIYRDLLHYGFDRTGTIIALGGGVIGDMAGFAAATFMRGVPFVQCPTSLLAMVDASVGGKTGVDLEQGKNLVGAFKQPQAVIIDTDTLHTLPPLEFANGLAEIIKHGLLADPDLFHQLHASSQLTTPDQWPALINRAIAVKQDVVQEDPYEHGRRATLNLGHTFGHAIEQLSRYAIPHGQAVALGLVAAAHLAHTLGHTTLDLITQIEQTLTRHNLPTRIPQNLPAKSLIKAMGSDKKKSGNTLRFILPRTVGDCFITADVPTTTLTTTLDALATAPPVDIPLPKPKGKRINHKHLSKKLSHILRHAPDHYGLTLEDGGWISIDKLLPALRRRRDWKHIELAHILDMMKHANKKRFEFADGRLRARYGHTFDIKIEHQPATPPPTLYHGTPPQVAQIILQEGLKPMKRQYVHLSTDIPTAHMVGSRRSDNPAILHIDSASAHAAGHTFYQASGDHDDVWLSDAIPPEFITLPQEEK
ncbi:MAG TPA: 3-dehydroquinate synthase [Anaerolineae bacterium]|nr:3-dehydroquinate synthase [Anaerolineae bacterium]